MVELFSDYIKNISVCVIFSAFVEMLLPTNNFKKYIEIVLGFIVIIVILNPLKNILFYNSSLDIQVFNKTSQIENEAILKNKNIYETKQRQLIIDTYKNQIENQIKELILKKYSVEIESLNIEVDEAFESDDFAQIKKIELYCFEKEQLNQSNNKNKIEIKAVQKIEVNKNSEDTHIVAGENRNLELEKNLQTLISDFYKLNEDNIYIIVHIK